jgi:hypothetical protein
MQEIVECLYRDVQLNSNFTIAYKSGHFESDLLWQTKGTMLIQSERMLGSFMPRF